MALPLHGRCPHLERGPHTPTYPPYPYPLGGEHLPTPPLPTTPSGSRVGSPPPPPPPPSPSPTAGDELFFHPTSAPGAVTHGMGGGDEGEGGVGGGRKEKPKEGRVVLTLPMLGLRMGIASMEHPGGVLPE